MRLLLVLAAIYDSTGSSDVGRRAEGEHAVSSKAIQRLATSKPFFLFYCHSTLSGSKPPHVGRGGNEAPAPRLQMIEGVGVCFFQRWGGGTSCLVHLANAKLCCISHFTIKIRHYEMS